MSDLVFEIGCEELPARFIDPALKALKAAFEAELSEARLEVGHLRVEATPRRLALIATGVAERQRDLSEERTGPPERAAWRDGEPTKAALGFARGQGVEVDELYIAETAKGRYAAARIFERGRAADEVLPGVLERAAASLKFPKSMRWGRGQKVWARPVRWVAAVLGGEPLVVSVAGVPSDVLTYGHRFAAPGPIAIESPEQYEVALERASVTLSIEARRAEVRRGVERAAREAGGVALADPELVAEVAHLVESPHALCVRFDEAYLDLPDEVLISSMRSHQRYFAIAGEGGALLNACAVIYNTPVRDPEVVRAGNLRVLKARLDDAVFFWRGDQRRTLEERLADLDAIVWMRGLGSVHQRTERIGRLAARLAELVGAPEAAAHAAHAGRLAKADLGTQMVGEFPDLQGIMGREYALREGLPEPVAFAIGEQYLPKGPSDATPATVPGALVAAAEKLDALVGAFGLGLAPTASSDPFALRRAALGFVRIILDQVWTCGLGSMIEASLEVYAGEGEGAHLSVDPAQITVQVSAFVRTRAEHLLATTFSADLIDAAIAAAGDDLVGARDRVRALAALRDEADFEPLAAGFKRVVNIVRKAEGDGIEIPERLLRSRLGAPSAEALAVALERAERSVGAALPERDWASALGALIGLKAPIDRFFDDVMVLVDDHDERAQRLALLAEVRRLFLRVADVSRVHTA